MTKQKHVSYDKFSAKTEEVVAEPEVLEVEEVTVEPAAPVKEPRKGYPIPTALNVRKGPDITAGVVFVIDDTVELIEDPSFENEEWCKIYTVAGIEGYCMKKFIDFK